MLNLDFKIILKQYLYSEYYRMIDSHKTNYDFMSLKISMV